MARTHGDRLARIEENLKSHTTADETRLASIDHKLEKLAGSIDSISLTLSKQRGFIAGMMFVISAVWAVILAAFNFRS